MAAIIPDHTRKWVKGTAYYTPENEYSKEGTIIGVGTVERLTYARACGVAYASPVTIKLPEVDLFQLLFD